MNIKFQFNDGGREAAGFKGQTNDCGIRAIAIACGIDYLDACELAESFFKKERVTKRRRKGKSSVKSGIYVATYHKIMSYLGFEWVPTMTIGSGCQVHLHPEELPDGVIICRVSKHYTTMIDGTIHDTYDPSREGTRCVYGYWKKDLTKD